MRVSLNLVTLWSFWVQGPYGPHSGRRCLTSPCSARGPGAQGGSLETSSPEGRGKQPLDVGCPPARPDGHPGFCLHCFFPLQPLPFPPVKRERSLIPSVTHSKPRAAVWTGAFLLGHRLFSCDSGGGASGRPGRLSCPFSRRAPGGNFKAICLRGDFLSFQEMSAQVTQLGRRGKLPVFLPVNPSCEPSGPTAAVPTRI